MAISAIRAKPRPDLGPVRAHLAAVQRPQHGQHQHPAQEHQQERRDVADGQPADDGIAGPEHSRQRQQHAGPLIEPIHQPRPDAGRWEAGSFKRCSRSKGTFIRHRRQPPVIPEADAQRRLSGIRHGRWTCRGSRRVVAHWRDFLAGMTGEDDRWLVLAKVAGELTYASPPVLLRLLRRHADRLEHRLEARELAR